MLGARRIGSENARGQCGYAPQCADALLRTKVSQRFTKRTNNLTA